MSRTPDLDYTVIGALAQWEREEISARVAHLPLSDVSVPGDSGIENIGKWPLPYIRSEA